MPGKARPFFSVCRDSSHKIFIDYSTGRVMASISGMLPAEILVIRDGNTFK